MKSSAPWLVVALGKAGVSAHVYNTEAAASETYDRLKRGDAKKLAMGPLPGRATVDAVVNEYRKRWVSPLEGIHDHRVKKNPPKKKRSSKKRTRAFQIQSVLLEIDYFTPTRARVWLQSNGHKFGNLEESDRFYHARQYDPGDYQHGTLHNIQLAKHVEAVVGIPIEGTSAYEAKGYNKRGPRQTRLPLKQKAPYKGYSEEMGF